MYEILQSVGLNLHTFHLRCIITTLKFDEKLWGTLPRVERLQLPYSWHNCAIPQNRPLRTVQISPIAVSIMHSVPYEIFLPYFSDRPLTIRMSETWSKFLLYSSRHQIELLVAIGDYSRARGFPFIDENSENLSRCTRFLITAFWKQLGRVYRKAQSITEDVPMLF